MQDQLTEVGGQFPDVGTRISKSLELYGAFFVPFLTISIATLPFSILGVIPVVGLIVAIPAAFVSLIVNAALITATGQAVLGQPPTPWPNLSGARNKLGRLFGLGWRTVGTMLLLAITIVGIPWAIRVGVRWFLGTQAIMLHDLEPKDAISESCRLVEGNWWRTFGNLLLIGFIFTIPSVIGFGITFGVSPVAGGIIGGVITVFTAPLFAIAYTLYYLRLRQEKGAPAVGVAGISPSPEPA